MIKAIATIIAIFFGGCVTPPQTSDEVRQGVKSGAAFTKIERQEINRSFKSVFAYIGSGPAV